MDSINEFFPAWTGTLGWTLLYSLWQGLLVMGFVALALRLIPSGRSQLRYGIACAGMVVIPLLNLATFVYLRDSDHSFVSGKEILFNDPAVQPFLPLSDPSMLNSIDQLFMLIDSQMPFVIIGWIVGAIFFSLRMLSGWWYISSIRSEAAPLNDQWHDRLQVLAQHLGIHRIISLAQSTRLQTPIVTGWLKPIILIPVGMLSGLTTEQIETIFIHELAHIRRHDYFINLIQSFIEALFFFNPFVWMISNIIRREREYCCDDTVTSHGNALAYAHALTHLEEVRLSKSMFALSLAENKNQLLNRIKRIMEKSAKNYSIRERMIPAVLLTIGLVCASWLTIKDDDTIIQERSADEATIAADTIDKKKTRSATYSKKIITTYDANGEPQQKIVEDFEGDEELRSVMPDLTFDFHMPQFPDAPSFPGIPDAHGVPDFDVMVPPFANFQFDIDSIPGKGFGYRTEKDWEEFSKAFEEKFSERFGEFYSVHEKDFEKMMKELEEAFSERVSEDDLAALRPHELGIAAQGKQLEEMERLHEEMLRDAKEHARDAAKQAKKQMEELLEHDVHDLKNLEHQSMLQAEQLIEMEERLKATEIDMESFEKELTEMLIKDGYINKEDELKTINWNDEADIEINGKNIKDRDKNRYKKLHRKYFEKSGNFHYSE